MPKSSRCIHLFAYFVLVTEIDECESYPCVQGNCTDQVNGYLCDCMPGFRGVSCDTG